MLLLLIPALIVVDLVFVLHSRLIRCYPFECVDHVSFVVVHVVVRFVVTMRSFIVI